jgi:hypothetical protein
MADAGIGRILIASLHQGIADVEPTRLEFYEPWLAPSGLRERRVGLAPLNAALSFLRLEGHATYDRIMTRAGQCSADWAFENWPAFERTLVRRLPAAWRVRSALKLGRSVVRGSFESARATVRLRRGQGTVHIRASVFCSTRETLPAPTCTYYAAVFARALELLRIDGTVRIRECRAAGGGDCTLDVTIRGSRAAGAEAEAA